MDSCPHILHVSFSFRFSFVLDWMGGLGMNYILYFTVCFSYWCNYHYYALLCTGQLLVHPVALLSFFIPSVFMLFCLISLHYVNGINKVMMMMMMNACEEFECSELGIYWVIFLRVLVPAHAGRPGKAGKWLFLMRCIVMCCINVCVHIHAAMFSFLPATQVPMAGSLI